MAQKRTRRNPSRKPKPSTPELRALRRSIVEVGRAYDTEARLRKSVSRTFSLHDFAAITRAIESIRRGERQPPDDLGEELRRLAEKLDRVRRAKPGDDGPLERKVPWRYQISLDLLISILIEILDILKKLYRRTSGPRP